MRFHAWPLILTALVLGCTLNRTALFDEDVGVLEDAPGRDAPRPDVPRLDADLDVPERDAPIPEDGGACGPTSAMEMLCDRVDDDCDGTIDDDDVCGCIALTVAGRAYLSCPPATGFAAWAGACRTRAPGYDLAVFSSGAEQADVLVAIRALAIGDPHWIGLNDFEVNGTYVWRDRSTTFTPTDIGADDPAKRFVILRDTGVYEELLGGESNRLLCEVAVLPTECRGGAEAPDCDGIDQDCNGVVDDGIDCGHTCVATTFWDHVYYACAETRNHGEAIGDCDGEMGALLASVNHRSEHDFLARAGTVDAWLGLAQETSAGAVDAGWHWADGFVGYGAPATRGESPWAPSEPNDADPGSVAENNEENCGLLVDSSSLFNDDACNVHQAYFCERSWTYPTP